MLSIGGSAGTLTVTGTEVTIEDDETVSTAVTLTAAPDAVSEGASGTAVTVTAALDGDAFPSDTEVTVTVGDAADAAVEGTDYESVSDFTITIAGGSTSGSGSFTLTPADDSLGEGDEALSIGGSAGTLTVTGTEVTIEDDETVSTAVTLTAAPDAVSGGRQRDGGDGDGGPGRGRLPVRHRGDGDGGRRG